MKIPHRYEKLGPDGVSAVMKNTYNSGRYSLINSSKLFLFAALIWSGLGAISAVLLFCPIHNVF